MVSKRLNAARNLNAESMKIFSGVASSCFDYFRERSEATKVFARGIFQLASAG